MKKAKVLAFGFRGFPNVQGGIETHAENLYPLMVDRGFEMHCVIRSRYKNKLNSDVWNGVEFHHIPAPKIKGVETLVHSLLSVLYAIKLMPDLIHVHAIGPSLVLPLIRLLGFKVIVTHHGPEYESQKWGAFQKLLLKTGEYFGMRFSHQRITVSNDLHAKVKRKHGVDSYVIPNGIFLPTLPVSNEAIIKYSLAAYKYVLLVSRLVPEKRHADLIDAFMQSNVTDWKLVIVGASDHMSEYASELHQKVKSDDRVVFTGFQTGNSLSELYANAGLFVLPSSIEGLPIAILEALSYGLPVIASDIPANLEIGMAEENYFRLGDVDQLAKKIELFSTRTVDISGREATRKWVYERYNWHDISVSTSEVFMAALSR